MSVNIWTFLFEVLNFMVLVAILQRLLYRPLHQALDRRREQIEQAQAAAEAARVQAATLQQQLTEQVAAIDTQRRQVLATAQSQALAAQAQLMSETQQDVEKYRTAADTALKQQQQALQEQLRADTVALALDVAARLLQQVCEPDLQRQLARRLIEALEQLSDQDRATLRAGWRPGAQVTLETARDLDSTSLAELQAALAAIMGQEVPVSLTPKPALIGGLRLLLNGQVWDASLAAQLEEARHATPAASS